MDVVVFRLGAEFFGIPVMRVVQVFPVAEIAPLPNAPATVRGTIDIHGDRVPVVDLGQRTSGAWTALHLEQQFLLVDAPGGRRVLLADEVEGVRPLAGDTFADAGLIDVDGVLPTVSASAT